MEAGNSTTWHGPCKRSVLATKFRAYEPNSEMIVSTFEEDLLGLKEFANRLDKFIATEQKFVEGSLVIALSAKFGFGKTTFLKMWSSSLKNAKKNGDKPIVVSLNAWESDYCGDPLYPIISALVERIKKEGESPEKIINAAKDLGWGMAAIGGQILKKFSGIDILAVGNFALVKREKRLNEHKPDTFSDYEDRKESMHKLKLALQDFVENSKRKILFMVDELDRCRPDYAINYLETIKHIFDVKGAVFILAADRQQLENSAKKAFGADLDFEEYYRKFVHREVSLPEISKENYAKLVREYVDYYLEREGSRICFMELDNYQREKIAEIIGALNLTPRQIQEVFRILGHICETTDESQVRLPQNFGLGSIIMAVLKIGESKVYDRLGNQSLEQKEAFEFLKGLLGEDCFGWWFRLILTGGGLKMEKDERDEDILTKFGLFDVSYNPVNPVDLSGWRSEWGMQNSNGLVQIYNKIEQISQWN